MSIRIPALVLIAIHAAALFAGFLAPYSPSGQDRTMPFAPPMRPRFVDPGGGFHWRPFVLCGDPQQVCPIRFFVRRGGRLRLFGVDGPGRIFLLGTDAFGRDQFSRILYGARISLAAGLLATLLTLALGAVLGVLAGFYAGWCDAALMRLAELFLALPWLYLLLAVRAFLPLSLSPARTFLLLIGVIGVVGWARPARLVRGILLSAREREFVHAARGFGASDWHILLRHVLPEAWPVILVQAGLLVPQYILAEVTMSFLGLGAGEPAPSWGGMLAPLREPAVLAAYWWMALPALVLLPVVICYNQLARGRA